MNWVAFSPDSKRLVSGAGKMEFTGNDVGFKFANSDDNSARLWEVASGGTLAILRGHGTRVRYAEFSPYGQRIVTSSDDRTARVCCHGNVPAGPYGPARLAVCSARPHAWAWRVGTAGASRRLEPGEAGRAPTFLG